MLMLSLLIVCETASFSLEKRGPWLNTCLEYKSYNLSYLGSEIIFSSCHQNEKRLSVRLMFVEGLLNAMY